MKHLFQLVLLFQYCTSTVLQRSLVSSSFLVILCKEHQSLYDSSTICDYTIASTQNKIRSYMIQIVHF